MLPAITYNHCHGTLRFRSRAKNRGSDDGANAEESLHGIHDRGMFGGGVGDVADERQRTRLEDPDGESGQGHQGAEK